MLDAERRMSPAAVAAMVPAASAETMPEATVIQLARPVHDLRRRPTRQVAPEIEARRDAEIAEFRLPPAPQSDRPEASDADRRFERAMRLELALTTGGDLGESELEWLTKYRTSSEYRTRLQHKKDREEFGQAGA
jgi:hypothetical protein